ncbi:sensor histidine kinase [Thermosynechococcus sp.]|uniref:sensor histidine kinase n=1 Tax=Thermosynechococcus sp. TaxID=2814275 RepID=UPI00391D2CA2
MLNRQYSSLRSRLFWIYFLAIAGILSASSVLLYSLIVHHRYQQFDTHLKEVAIWSVNLFDVIEHEYSELTRESKYSSYAPKNNEGKIVPMTISQLMAKHEFNSIYEVMPNPTRHISQSVQWYDRDRYLIIYEGQKIPEIEFPPNISPSGVIIKGKHTRSFIYPIYKERGEHLEPALIGYVCATDSTVDLENELNYLKVVFILKTLGVSTLALLVAAWLTHESTQPIVMTLNRLKRFTADASHQLRHPVTAIQASIAMLAEHSQNLDAAQLNKVAVISSACHQMGDLINKLLLLARMEQSPLDQSRRQKVDVDELLEEVVDLHRDRATAKGIILEYYCEQAGQVWGDPEQLYELFANLVDNAINYTPPSGTITLRLTKKLNTVIISVQDTGIGIAPQDLPYIFERFWRSDEAREHHNKGSGLGLSVVKMIVEQHHGSIQVESQPHQGTRFEVKLPAA